jgi:hypothetical protein
MKSSIADFFLYDQKILCEANRARPFELLTYPVKRQVGAPSVRSKFRPGRDQEGRARRSEAECFVVMYAGAAAHGQRVDDKRS